MGFCPMLVVGTRRVVGERKFVDVDHVSCEQNCEWWNKELKCCNEVAQTIIIEKYLKEIVNELAGVKINLAPH